MNFVKHDDIDPAKWDKALEHCYNENPYGYSQWLSMVSPGWCALINEDYSVLMPLPVKKKLGISYISQPRFTQQLGVYSTKPLEHEFIKSCLHQIPKRYAKIYLQLNTENYFPMPELRQRITYCLSLNNSFEQLYSDFSSHHKRNISKSLEIATQNNLTVSPSQDHKSFIEHFRNTIGRKDKSLKKSDYELMHKIISSPVGRLLVCSTGEGEIQAGLFYMESKTKLVNLFNFTTPRGKENKAMYLMLNQWIKQYTEKELTLDFEGSEIKSIAKFYNGFGALAKNYQIFTKKGFWQM